MAVTMQVDIVSAEGQIFSGKAEMLFAQAADGEVGILPHHTQFLSRLKPGTVRVVSGDEEQHFYVNSGIIEIQPSMVTVLADSAIRAADLDEAEAQAAKQRAEEAMANAKSETDIARAQVELAEAVAQIQSISKLRDRLHKTGLA
ncbi:MAG: F0F1 ATP synthase subunit epsilon [Gammaproteobacteria bacterium]|uniref:F0F1 ATP synthase subunit epsilon n=1 Tax=Thiomicrorhabdus cannonii TaxID=2748011 RepID=UPI0015B80240|nr:F0F1 ATP synthase subunit epsilon [Thiomicrorhabdus cannonii]MBD3754863.1 F0F1 ATP synthase subunit epsilon [Gammaproteobacteria bacterium]MBD3767944.1 F0F1 ATP synthase subunit epsilon [Gammaproteobacteria bacterium]MBD3777114.1 F0F1 ATP synthase subunit epsilon [Thiotrichales bacterium]